MKLKSLLLIGAFAVGAYTLVEAQQLPTFPEPAKTPSTPWAEKGSLRTACLQEVYRFCSGKQGQDARECRKSTAEKLCCGCKVGDSK